MKQPMKQLLKGGRQGVHNFGEHIAVIVNSVLLLIVYLIGVGITSLIAKAVGKHFMDLKTSADQETYWLDLDLQKEEKESYYKQF